MVSPTATNSFPETPNTPTPNSLSKAPVPTPGSLTWFSKTSFPEPCQTDSQSTCPQYLVPWAWFQEPVSRQPRKTLRPSPPKRGPRNPETFHYLGNLRNPQSQATLGTYSVQRPLKHVGEKIHSSFKQKKHTNIPNKAKGGIPNSKVETSMSSIDLASKKTHVKWVE